MSVVLCGKSLVKKLKVLLNILSNLTDFPGHSDALRGARRVFGGPLGPGNALICFVCTGTRWIQECVSPRSRF